MTIKKQADTQKAFEEGASYAVSYLYDVIENLAKGVEEYNSGTAGLLRYIQERAAEYNCGEYPGEQ